jgi:hypothetical protein
VLTELMAPEGRRDLAAPGHAARRTLERVRPGVAAGDHHPQSATGGRTLAIDGGRKRVQHTHAGDPRARRFEEIAALIVGRERALRKHTWDVPAGDLARRLLAAERYARRSMQLAESAWLAHVRRSGLRRSAVGAIWLST